MLDSIKQAFQNAWFSYNQYEGNGSYFTLFFISIIILYFFYQNRDRNNIGKLYTVFYPLLAFIMIFNPIVAGPVILVIKDYVYWRSFWIIPITLIISLAMAVFVMKNTNTRYRLIAMISCCVVIGVSGSLIISPSNYQKPANWYKLPQEAVSICQMIRKETDGYAKVAVPVQLVSYIRQYDATILMPYGRRHHSEHALFAINLSTNLPDIAAMKEYLDHYDVNFFVIIHELPFDIILPDWCEIIGSTGNYHLLRTGQE